MPDPARPAAPEALNPVPSHVEGMRSFSLNSPEAFEALCPRQGRPWIANGALPREPRRWEQPVLKDESSA